MLSTKAREATPAREKGMPAYARAGGLLYALLASAFFACVCIQVFFAGMGAFGADWSWHVGVEAASPRATGPGRRAVRLRQHHGTRGGVAPGERAGDLLGQPPRRQAGVGHAGRTMERMKGP